MAKAGEYDAIMQNLEMLNSRVERLDEKFDTKLDALKAQLAATRGDTVGVEECKTCRGNWVDKRFFTVGLAVATGVLALIAGLRGLW
jgi:hypothetical protein